MQQCRWSPVLIFRTWATCASTKKLFDGNPSPTRKYANKKNEAKVQLTRLENCLEIMQLNLLTRLEKCLEIMQLTLVIGWLALILSYIKNRTEPSCIHYSVPFRDAAKHSFQVVYRHFFISTMVRTYSSSEPLPAIISTTCRSFVFCPS